MLEDAEAALGKIGVEGEWLRLRTPEGVEGYCAAQLFGVFDGSRPTAPGTTGQGPGVSPDAPVYVTPTEDRVQVRDQPGEEGEPIGTLSQGDVVEVIEERATALEKIACRTNGCRFVRLRERKATPLPGITSSPKRQNSRAFTSRPPTSAYEFGPHPWMVTRSPLCALATC